MKFCIILYDRVFEKFRAYNMMGYKAPCFQSYAKAQETVKSWRYTEVPINSRIGRKILEKIGERKV